MAVKIFQRGSKTWHFRFYNGNGKPIQGSCKTENYALAQKIGAKAERDYIESVHLHGGKPMPLGEAIDLYLSQWTQSAVSLKHAKSFCNRLRGLRYDPHGKKAVKSVPGLDTKKNLHDLKTEDVTVLIAHLTAEGKSLDHKAHLLGHLRRIIKNGADNGARIPSDKECKIPAIAKSKGRDREISDHEEDAIIDDLKKSGSNQSWAFFTFLLYTGMRAGSAGAMLWKHVNWAENTIELHHSKGTATVSIGMSQELIDALKHMQTISGGETYIFPGAVAGTHRAYTRVWLTNCLSRVGFDGKYAEIHGKIGQHVCRHTFATRLLRASVPIYDVSKAMGHSSIKETERYAHAIPASSGIANAFNKKKAGKVNKAA